MRLVLLGDGESPHLLKWARALAPRLELWAASSRGFMPGFDAFVPAERRLALGTSPRVEGGNLGLLRELPKLVAWLRSVRADWIHAHYLSSHGTLAWLATAAWRVPGRVIGSAWGSDILVAPERSALMRYVTRRVLRHCTLATSDSAFMAGRMRALGAQEVMVFPFGLEALPAASHRKDDALFFANRALDPLYRPDVVLEAFAAVARDWPQARLVVANDGSQRGEFESQAAALGLGDRVRFTGRLDAAAQARCYDEARWYLSLPASDSVSVSVLEAMAHGCVPLLSDLPANRELVRDGENGLILCAAGEPLTQRLNALEPALDAIAERNRQWVQAHAIFPDAVDAFVQRLRELQESGS